MPPLLAALPLATKVSAGIQAGGTIFNAASQALQNRANRRFNLQMYERQRNDALTDWNMQNEYNSPAQQMARYKQAGLNPNLIYGQTNESAPIRTPTTNTPTGGAPQLDVNSVTDQYFNSQIKTQQVDNMAVQNRILEKEIELKGAQTLLAFVQSGLITAKTGEQIVKNKYADVLGQYSVDSKRLQIEQQGANLTKTAADTKFTISEDKRRDAKLASDLKTDLERRLTMIQGRQLTTVQMQKLTAEIANAAKEGKLKDWEIALNKVGTTKDDNPLKALTRNVPQVLDNLIKKILRK